MNKTRLILILGWTILSSAAGLSAAQPPASVTAADSIPGKISLNMRLRYEYADQDGLKASNAFTLRTRLGYETPAFADLKAFVQFEDVTALGNGDNYNQAGINPGGAGRTVVADPETTELNQAFAEWSADGTTAKLGRQAIILDNARFVGDVGWRQNQQTYDAVSVQSKALANTEFTAAYINRVNRVFGYENKGGRWYSDSYLFNAAYTGLPIGKIAAYAYRFDFSNAAASSGDTVGAYLAGAHAIAQGTKLAYRLEYARQVDNGGSPSGADFACDYWLAELSGALKPATVGAGWEVLGSDNGHGFQTPLATLHAFDGWADVFLSTPGAGLEDLYGFVAGKFAGPIPFRLVYHHFSADKGGADYGDEWDALASYALTPKVKFTAKFATFDGRPGFADRNKIWMQFDFAY